MSVVAADDDEGLSFAGSWVSYCYELCDDSVDDGLSAFVRGALVSSRRATSGEATLVIQVVPGRQSLVTTVVAEEVAVSHK